MLRADYGGYGGYEGGYGARAAPRGKGTALRHSPLPPYSCQANVALNDARRAKRERCSNITD